MPADSAWCPLITSLVCMPCCRKVRDLEPNAMVSLLSLTEIALTPVEVMESCADCSVRITDTRPASLKAEEPPSDSLPS
jgi:hypothetical protein